MVETGLDWELASSVLNSVQESYSDSDPGLTSGLLQPLVDLETEVSNIHVTTVPSHLTNHVAKLYCTGHVINHVATVQNHVTNHVTKLVKLTLRPKSHASILLIGGDKTPLIHH